MIWKKIYCHFHWCYKSLKKRQSVPFFCSILQQISFFFSFLVQKMFKKPIWTSFWSEQHPNAGPNIQHPSYLKWIGYLPFFRKHFFEVFKLVGNFDSITFFALKDMHILHGVTCMLMQTEVGDYSTPSKTK